MRFPEFSGEWKKCIIQDYGEVVTGNTPPTNNAEYYNNGSYLWASPADLGINKNVTDTKTKLSLSGFKKTRNVPKGSVLVTCIGSTIGKMGMATETMSSNQQINSVVVNDKNNSDFVYYAICRAFPRYLSEVGVQAVPILSKSNFEKLPNYTTSRDEQNKIGYFLSLLDERIATQNKIIDKLQSLIKGLVVTHYSTNPHTIKAKIRDLGEAYSTMSMSKEQLTANGNPCIFYGELFTIYGCVIDEVKSKTHIKKEVSTLSRGRDLLFPASTTVDALSLIVPSTLMEKDIILGGDMFAIKISQEYNPLYLSYYFNYIANKRLSKYAKGTTIIHLHYNEIANVVVELPSIEEQGKIIAAIQGYTTKLDIEEALLERILDLKQYLLRQMFI
ncbi:MULTISPECIES: restriction endonuclease subunit S [Bacteroidales]|uniref:Type I restriction modification DNA specificity domain-containing protein n=1 Tax=Parabacteroides distasonis TaxID=823 RepID=A0A6I2N8K7_PARDI|nr:MULTISPECIES: restriction endonuclease subunit S [Bacteroidales]MCB6978763.1 restriction endonuclease subunit S [Bacteroides uniformis]MRY83759.1 hypothetical protein [Parabacteroides distasonis]